MSYVAHITNTRVNRLSLMYRVPGKAEPGKSLPLVTIVLEPRAFRTPVAFASDEHFAAFKNQNISLIENGTILLGDKVKEKDAEKVNEKNANEEVKEIRAKKGKVVKTLEDAATTKNTKLEVRVEKDSE